MCLCFGVRRKLRRVSYWVQSVGRSLEQTFVMMMLRRRGNETHSVVCCMINLCCYQWTALSADHASSFIVIIWLDGSHQEGKLSIWEYGSCMCCTSCGRVLVGDLQRKEGAVYSWTKITNQSIKYRLLKTLRNLGEGLGWHSSRNRNLLHDGLLNLEESA